MNDLHTVPPEKVVTSIALDKDVREWVNTRIPKSKRSQFFNRLARRYIKRVEKQEREQVTA